MAKKSPIKFLFWLGLACFAIGCFAVILVIIYFELQLPNVSDLKDVQLQVPLRIFTPNGKLIAEYGEKRRNPVRLKQIPSAVIDATLATEDQRYYYHSGVDILGLLRAAVVLVTTGRKEQGGSTITMQVARNYFLTRRKTFTRKIKEILLAYKIDHTLSKDKVLELYFNKIFYGNRAYGISAASHVYYGKPLAQLTLAQSAMLAGLPQAPSYLNPIANPKAALVRRDHVLWRLHDEKYITQQQYQQALQEPVTAKYHDLKPAVNAPYVAEMAKNEMLQKYGKQAYSIGLKVFTTIQPNLQKDANKALTQGVLAYDKRHGYRGPLENLGSPVPTDLTAWQASLKKIPNDNVLQAAAILSISDTSKTVTAMLADGTQIKINWPAMGWARKQYFKNGQEYLGNKPNKPSDILKVGDVIFTNQKNNQWQLSQAPQAESALVSIDPQTGAILALVGGFNYEKSNFNRVVQAYRQPGSSFKPFIYSAALAKGFTLASMINDAPVVIAANNDNGLWRPENDTRKFYGMTSLKEALMQSRNLVSIRLLQLIGIPYAIDYATRFGFKPNQMPHGLSLALGTASVTPLQMAEGYSIFANGGYRVTAHLINHITDSNGKILFQTQTPIVCDATCQTAKQANNTDSATPAPVKPTTSTDAANGSTVSPTRPDATQVITPQNAFLMTQAMKAVITDGTGKQALSLNRPDLAGKTGTTNKKIDAWFSGYDHTLVTTAWIGFDKPRPLYEYGEQAALPIWINFMKSALKGKPESNQPTPSNIISVRINPKTGKAANAGTKNAIFEYFRQQYAPQNAGMTGPADANSDNLEQEIYQ